MPISENVDTAVAAAESAAASAQTAAQAADVAVDTATRAYRVVTDPIVAEAQAARNAAIAARDSAELIALGDAAALIEDAVNNRVGYANVRSYGATGDGVTDDTAAIQAAIDNVAGLGGGTVYVPPGRYMVDATAPDTLSANYLGDEGGIALADNVTLELAPKATIAAIPNNVGAYVIVRLYDVTNAALVGGRIEGERLAHTADPYPNPGSPSPGEWGYGVAITGGTNITLRDVTIAECWGDGINVQRLGSGAATDADYTTNLRLDNVTATDNRRQGMSIEGVRGLYATGSTFARTGSLDVWTAPACGVDLEPWLGSTLVEDVVFHGCRFVDNRSAGLLAMQALHNVTVSECVFEGNTDSEAQLKTYTVDGRGIRIVNNRISTLGAPAGQRPIRAQGGTDYLIAGNLLDRGILVALGPAAIVRNVTISNNTLIAPDGETSSAVWIVGAIEDVTIDGNTFDYRATEAADPRAVEATGGGGAKVRRLAITRNRFINVARGIGLTDVEDVTIDGNDLDNPRVAALTAGATSGLEVTRNTIAGACHGNDGQPVIYLGADTTRVRLLDNTIRQDPRIADGGAGTGRAVWVLSFVAGVRDVITRGNRVVPGVDPGGFGFPLYPPSIYIAETLTTGYLGNERGLMVDTTAYRPSSPAEGTTYYDTTLDKLITYTGAAWKDGANATV